MSETITEKQISAINLLKYRVFLLLKKGAEHQVNEIYDIAVLPAFGVTVADSGSGSGGAQLFVEVDDPFDPSSVRRVREALQQRLAELGGRLPS